MELLHPHCAGLDVHKELVVACIRHMEDGKENNWRQDVQGNHPELVALSDWLCAEGCTHIAMEATGVYWKPVWHLLLRWRVRTGAANAHVKNVPGRKSDVNDAMWLADLMAYGPYSGKLCTRRTHSADARSAAHPQAVRARAQRPYAAHPKDAGRCDIKLDSVITDIVGLSGRRMIEALIAGQTDPQTLAALAHRRIRDASADELEAALRGRVTAHHRFMLRLHLNHLDAVDEAIASIDKEVGANVEPFRVAIETLTTIPGSQFAVGRGDGLADRHRHEPLRDRRPSDLLAGSAPGTTKVPESASTA